MKKFTIIRTLLLFVLGFVLQASLGIENPYLWIIAILATAIYVITVAEYDAREKNIKKYR